MKHFFMLLVAIALSSFNLQAQDEIVRENLLLLAHGKVNEVKAKIPDLLAKYPNNPGIKLLHGAILDDGSVAVEMYKNIIEKHPDSEWADDAYWRMVQYYAISGDLEKASNALEIFRRRYPSSPFVAPASDVVMTVSKMQTTGKMANVTKAEPKKDLSLNSDVDIQSDKINSEPEKSPDEIQKKDFARPIPDKALTPKDETTDVVDSEESVTENEFEEMNEEMNDDSPVQQIDLSDNHDGYYGLQVGIYNDPESAEAEKEKFLSKRLRTSVAEKNIDGKTMYAVVIGHYSSLQSAEAAKILVRRQCGCDPIIYEKTDDE